MKKLVKISIVMLLVLISVTACGKDEKKEKRLELSVSEIVDKIYDNIPEDQMPSLGNTEVTDENVEYYLGTKDIDYKKAIASEPLMSSNAWSVVIVELNDGADIDKAKKDIKENVDPRKWVCVEAEKVVVESRDNKIILIMMNSDNAKLVDTILENFKNL